MKRFRTLLVIFFIAALVLFISSCWPMLPSISLTIQGSNREPGKPIMIEAMNFRFAPNATGYIWKLEKELGGGGWQDITAQNLKIMKSARFKDDTVVVYIPTVPETGRVKITARATGQDDDGALVTVEYSQTVSYNPKTSVLVEVFEKAGTTFGQPSTWFGAFSFSWSNRVPNFVRYKEGFLESGVGFDPYAQRLLFGIDPTSAGAIYNAGEVFFQAWTKLPSNTYSNAQMSTMFNNAPTTGDWAVRIEPTTFSGWRATGWKVKVQNIDRFTDDLWLFRARKSDNRATHLVKINSYYVPGAMEEFVEEDIGTFVSFAFSEGNLLPPGSHLWDEDYYFGVIAVQKTAPSSQYNEEDIIFAALKGSAMVLFPNKSW